MIYTVGNRHAYLKTRSSMPPGKRQFKIGKREPGEDYPYGYKGGVVFKTIEDANRYIDDGELKGYAVFGLLADWDMDTKADPE